MRGVCRRHSPCCTCSFPALLFPSPQSTPCPPALASPARPDGESRPLPPRASARGAGSAGPEPSPHAPFSCRADAAAAAAGAGFLSLSRPPPSLSPNPQVLPHVERLHGGEIDAGQGVVRRVALRARARVRSFPLDLNPLPSLTLFSPSHSASAPRTTPASARTSGTTTWSACTIARRYVCGVRGTELVSSPYFQSSIITHASLSLSLSLSVSPQFTRLNAIYREQQRQQADGGERAAAKGGH